MQGMQPGQVILSLIGIVVVIFAAYYVTYFIGVKSQRVSRARGRNIALLDRFSISKDKSFCIVEIAGKVYIVGVTNQSMTLLDTLDAGEFAGRSGIKNSDEAAPGFPQGGMPNNLVTRLASFLSARTGGKPVSGDGYDSSLSPEGSSFKDSMAEASRGPGDNKTSGSPDRAENGRTDDPEGEE